MLHKFQNNLQKGEINKFNLCYVSDQFIQIKLYKLMKVYNECTRRGKYNTLNELIIMEEMVVVIVIKSQTKISLANTKQKINSVFSRLTCILS